MRLSDLSVNRAVFAAMLFIGLTVIGGVSYSKMAIDLFPDIEYPVAIIITEYEDVGPKEVESTVTRPLEEAVAGINNIETLSSQSFEGVSLVTVEFAWGTDMGAGVADIREKLDLIKQALPNEVGTPMVLKFDVSMMPILIIAVTGERSIQDIRNYAEDHLKSRFEQVDGVATADVIGGYEDEVKVELDRNRMDAYGISIDTITQVLFLENMNTAGGEVKTDIMKYTLRTRGEFQTLDDIRNVVVGVKNRTPVYLSDIGRVYMGPEEKDNIVRLNGHDGVIMILRKQSDMNTVQVARRAVKRLDGIQENLPAGIGLNVFFNQSEYIEKSINNLIRTAIQGGVIAIFVVFIFLRSMRAALILGLSIPLSIIITFIGMYIFDLSLNMMSLGGLALGVGMLIDNSIVILENVFRFRERGARPMEAAKLGADEMAMAITASTLTTISVFLPFLFTEGLAGQLFKDMALTIAFSLLASLLVALTLVPMMTSRVIKVLHPAYGDRIPVVGRLLDWTDKAFHELEYYYGRVIRWALSHRKRVVAYTGMAIVIGLVLLPFAGMEFIPEQDENRLTFYVELPVGTNLESTEEVMKMVEKRVMNVLKKDEYAGLNVRAGQGTGISAVFSETKDHMGKVEIRFTGQSERERSDNELRKILRLALRDVPGAKINFSRGGREGGGLGGSFITVEIYGYDLEDAASYTREIYRALEKIPGVYDLEISREEGLPEKQIIINRDKASKMGLNTTVVANMVKDSVAGKKSTIYRKEGEEYDVVVRLREEDRRTIRDILSLKIQTPTGDAVPLGNIINIKTISGPTAIERKKQERVVFINCKAEGRDLRSVALDMKKVIRNIVPPKNFHARVAGSYEDMNESFRDLSLALLLAVVLIYIIMASQFESLWAPFIIMVTMPTMIFGVSFFLFLTGTTFNVISFMGVLMLAGIVVNNAIVYVDYTNILRARGKSLHEALSTAGELRLRPILMTTFTTIFGLVPMAIGLGEGSELTTPLARAVIGGLSSSFIFTLVFLPVVYSLLEQIKESIQARLARAKGGY